MLAAIVIFSFLLKNIWISLFVGWTILLYSYFKFYTGQVYVTNIFVGLVLFYLVKVSFKKEHIPFFINGVLWFTILNIFYMSLQSVGFDFYFAQKGVLWGIGSLPSIANMNLYGFMGNYWALGSLLALTIPLIASREGLTAKIGALTLFFPLYLCNVSLCLLMAIVGLLFVWWFKLPKIVWGVTLIALIVGGGLYLAKVDRPEFSIRGKVWKQALRDASNHPIAGCGLDSFRNETKNKPYKYMQRMKESGNQKWIEVWDNPHNLYVSLFLEFSLVGLFIFCGYMRGLVFKYLRAIKSPQVIGLTGFVIVFLGVSFGHHPLFLARFVPILIPAFSMYEIATS